MIFSNPFVEVINGMNGLPTKVYIQPATDYLRRKYKEREAKLFITMQQVLAQVNDLLAPDEKIINFMPMTDENNSQMATGGVMGMYNIKTLAGKDYMKAQDSLRGNRLMIFTDRRIIFFILIEFIDDPTQYFSYQYSELHNVKLREHKQKVPLPENGVEPEDVWYGLDFETDNKHIFTEFLTQENGQLFKKNLLTIPSMQGIKLTDKVTINSRFDLIFGNVNGVLGWMMVLGIIYTVFMIFIIIQALISGDTF